MKETILELQLSVNIIARNKYLLSGIAWGPENWNNQGHWQWKLVFTRDR